MPQRVRDDPLHQRWLAGRGSIETTTDMPGRSTCFAVDSRSSMMRTGTRCTILVKLPVALSGGSSVKTEPVPPAMPLTVPWKTWPGSASTVMLALAPVFSGPTCVALTLAST